jgi:translation initiation factor IF-2
MSKIRAYKLAEELGIDRNEFVEKARAFGVELKNAMASLDEETAGSLRGKFGGGPSQEVVEKTVEAEGGRKVIRRRRRAKPAPEPAPEPVAVEPEPGVEDLEAPAAEPEPIAAEADDAEAPVAVDAEAEAEPGAPEEAGAPAPGPGRDAPAAPGAPREAPAPPGKGKQRKRVREVVNLKEQEQIARQVSGRTIVRRAVSVDPRSMQSPRRKRRDAPAKPQPAAVAAPKKERRVVRIEGSVTVGELARQLGQKAPAVQGKLMALGTMASVNQAVDAETAATVAKEFGFEVQDVGFREDEVLGITEEAVALENLVPRPPVITVMGHVDHGKTSILDALRKTDVVAGEAGGITQHIGAYQVTVGGEKLTFIDTPGHAAFTTMRARGAQATDIVVLVVAATEGAMPQTVEAIAHAKAAEVPIVVAVNKCDLPGANPQQTRQRLMEHDLIPEEFGGDIICVETSATEGTGLDKLLEMLKLQAELLELKADPNVRARGVVLEAELDRGRGPVATVLVQQGTLRRGDVVVLGTEIGRVRTMLNDKGQALKEAGPSMPVQLVGLSGVPEAGQPFHGVENERAAKDVVGHRVSEQRIGAGEPARPRRTLEELFAQIGEGTGPKELAVVIKADVQGSVEALSDTIQKLSTDEVKVKVIHSGVGAVSESDVMLARASDAIIVAFHVRPDPAARKEAESQGVDIRLYRVIYEATDEIRAAMAGLLPPRIEEKELGRAEVRETFTIPKIGTIAGSYVVDGLIRRNAQARLVRDGVLVYEGKVGSLKRFKDDAREVQTGFECGIGIDGYNDVKVGDVIEVFELQEKPATLE